MMFFVYILKCNDGSLYTGWTNDVTKRLNKHNEGKGAKYTRARLPVELVFYKELESKEQAMRVEYNIKKLKRENKFKIIQNEGYRNIFFDKFN